jgi:hydroxymethylpyrimidine/phosphomethylpyrimidine kinase
MDDLAPDIIKTGMLADRETIELISELIKNNKIVVDPVMVATSGDRLVEPTAIEAIINLLIPKAYLVTPNIHEAEILSNIKITDLKTQIDAGKKILEYGAENVLVKGGHTKSKTIHDCLIKTDVKEIVFESKRLDNKNTHGTGCSLASSIATLLGRSFGIEEATKTSIEYVQKGIKNAPNFGRGNGPILHFND